MSYDGAFDASGRVMDMGKFTAIRERMGIWVASKRAETDVEGRRLHGVWQDGADDLKDWGELTHAERNQWRHLARTLLDERKGQ